ncbi:MAG: TRAP transporter small permease [Sphaerochaeta sp.]|jgi:TRAP-type C4-dicarboxylate transport system permease small subunit
MNNFQSLLQRTRTFFEKVIMVERYVCSVALIIVTLITFVQVTMRFLFTAPFSWSEEVTLMILVWFGYLCMAIDIFTDDHAALYFLYNRLSPTLKKAADIMRHGLLAWFFSQMIRYGWMITKLNAPKRMPAAKFTQALMYAPLIAGGILMLIYSLINLGNTIITPRSAYHGHEDGAKTAEDLLVERGGTL